MVEIYTQAGAVYGRHTLEDYEKVEEEARYQTVPVLPHPQC